jgi:hypothetical protein
LRPLIHIQDPAESAGFYDKCISTSPNGLVYALSWYLDIVCPAWEILSTEDQTSVMPLPVSRSFGRKVLKQPEFAWQLGVFSTRIPSPEVIRHFIRSIPTGYRFRRLCLNKFNVVDTNRARFQNTAELDLIRPYRQIRSRYGPSLKKSLENAASGALSYVNNITVHEMLMFAYKLDRFNRHRLNPQEISILRLIATNAVRYRSGQIWASYDQHNNLIATVLFLVFRGRASMLHAAASSEGLASGGIEYLIDRFIEANAEENLVLCVDNPSNRKLMDILQGYGSGISSFPCLRGIS